MNRTSTAATTTQVVSIATIASWRVGSMTRSCERRAGASLAPCTGSAAGVCTGGERLRRHVGNLRADAVGQLVRLDLEQRVAVAAGGPDVLVAQERLVEHHGQVVPERGH